jgi:plastocyanin
MRHIYAIGSIALLVSACQQLPYFGTSAVPETSRTANVYDVRVNLTDIVPADLTVDVGDEVRFINNRPQPVRLILIEGGKSIACKRGFKGSIDQEAEISPGGSASFCFDKEGTVKYTARSKQTVAGGEKVLPAQIHITENASVQTPVKGRPMPSRSDAELRLTPTPRD